MMNTRDIEYIYEIVAFVITLVTMENKDNEMSEKETQLIDKWRAARYIYTTLTTIPQNANTAVKEIIDYEESIKGPQLPGKFRG